MDDATRRIGVIGAITALALAGSLPAVAALAGSPRAATALDTKLVVNDVPGPPSPFELQPPGETTGPPTNFQEFGTQPDFYFAKGDYPYEVFANPDDTGAVTGTYSVHESVSNVFGTDNKEDVVFDSTGAGPADGTVYDTYLSGVITQPFGGGVFESNYSVSGPDETKDLFEYFFGLFTNYFSADSSGVFDTLYLFGAEIPILDIPF
jgi:hypothetical protein